MAKRPSRKNRKDGTPVVVLVCTLFGVIILLFGGIAAYLYFASSGRNDVIGIMGGFSWVFALVCVEMLVIARKGLFKQTINEPTSGVSAKADVSDPKLRFQLILINAVALLGLVGIQIALYLEGRTGIPSLIATSFLVLFVSRWAAQKL